MTPGEMQVALPWAIGTVLFSPFLLRRQLSRSVSRAARGTPRPRAGQRLRAERPQP